MRIFKGILPVFLLSMCLSLSVEGQEEPFIRASVSVTSRIYRVLIESASPLQATMEKNGSTLKVRIRADRSARLESRSSSTSFVKSLGWSRDGRFYVLTIETQSSGFTYDTFSMDDPPRFFINIRPEEDYSRSQESGRERAVSPDGTPLQSGGRTTIVIDPGHGGLETGAKGKTGIVEKELNLEISRKLKAVIEKNLAYNVELTRDEDVEVSLEQRAALANNNNAILFISIHANSSYRKNARGPETYFLSQNATDKEARRLAYLENNEAAMENTISGPDEDEIKMILWDMAQTAFLRQSSLLAEKIQFELNRLFRTRNRGVRQAPFFVLSGVACPAVLVEMAFLSNADDEKRMKSADFQNEVVQAIYRGLLNYIRENDQ